MTYAKNKGTFAESATVKYLRDNGFPFADRRPLSGAKDRGDVLLCPGVIAEVKAHKRIKMGPWLAETEAERVNAGAEYAFLVVKPEGVGVTRTGAWYAAMYWCDLSYLAAFRHVVLSIADLKSLDKHLVGNSAVVFKPRGVTDIGRFYAVTTLSRMATILRLRGFGDPLPYADPIPC